MRFLLNLLLLCIIFTNAKAQITFLSQEEIEKTSLSNTFNDIPLQPHENNVDVYFNGEKPKEDFYKVRIIEVNDAYTYNDLLIHLKQKAQAEGFDGLLILGTRENVYQNNSIGSAITSGVVAGLTKQQDYHYTPSVITEHSLSAVGIKYKTRMNYITSIIKQALITFSDSLKTKYQINFSLTGSLNQTKELDQKYFYFQNISLFNSADAFAKKDIFSFISPDENDGRNIVTAKLKTNMGYIKYTAAYANASKVSDIEIKVPVDDGYNRFNVKYEVDNRIIKKRFISSSRKKTPLYTDVYNYDNKQNFIGFIRYNSKTNQEIFKLDYQYFDIKDLPEPEK